MTLIVPGDPTPRGQSVTPASTHQAPDASWINVLLLAVVLGSLIGLLLHGIELPQALAVVGAGGLMTAELRRRLP